MVNIIHHLVEGPWTCIWMFLLVKLLLNSFSSFYWLDKLRKIAKCQEFSQLIHPSDWDPSIRLYGVNFFDLGVFKLRCTKKRMSQMQLATCNNQKRLVFLISMFDDLLLLCCQIEISITLWLSHLSTLSSLNPKYWEILCTYKDIGFSNNLRDIILL
jgi:hypothetical protein